MTTARQLKKFEKALAEAQRVFDTAGIEIQAPIENHLDKIREAASVVAYFDMKEQFKQETCRNCNLKFAYSYYLTAVKCCSVSCMAAVLASMGLSWDPEAPLERRWGRYVPAIVPPVPYEIIQEQAPPEIQEEPVPDESVDLIKQLESLL